MIKNIDQLLVNLTGEQHNVLREFCSSNNTTKTDFIRMICEALRGIDASNASIVIHDNKNINVVTVSNKINMKEKQMSFIGTNTSDNVKRMEINMVYETNKPFQSKYEISKTETIDFGKVSDSVEND